MRRVLVSTVAALSLAAGGFTAVTAAPTRAPAPVERTIQGAATLHAFVQYGRSVTDADVARLRGLGISQLHAFRLINTVAVVAPGVLIRKAATLPGVVRIQQDHGLSLNLDESKKAIRADKARAKRPKGLGLTGKGVRVAVLDSGIDTTHPDLRDQVVKSYNFEGSILTDSWQDGAAGDQVASGTARFAEIDEVGHGTHVASTIAGTGEAAVDDTDYSGVAPGARLVNYKIASAGQGVVYDMGWEMNALAAIEHLIEHNQQLKVKIVSNSWGIFEVTDPDSEPVIQMVRAAIAHGLIFVFAAGNNGSGPNTVGWPGAMGNVITVAATEKTAPYEVAGFSSRGYQVDVAAPGSNIYAARNKGIPLDQFVSAPGAGPNAPFYMAISGTSMATPHVAGAVALLAQANRKLTGPLAAEILERTAVDLGEKGKDHDYGYGLINTFRAGKVAGCLADTKAKNREKCFKAVDALPKKRWTSDWKDKGDRSPTAQGGPIPV